MGLLEQLEAIGFDEARDGWRPSPARRSGAASADDSLLARRQRCLAPRSSASLSDAASPRPRRRRMDGGRRRPALPRRLQQRAGGRPRSPAGGRRHRAPGRDAQHEHALSPRACRRAGRAPGRDDARRPRHGHVRQLRLGGQRPRLAPGHDLHRSRCGPRHGLGYHGVTAAIADFSASEWPRGEQPAGVETFRGSRTPTAAAMPMRPTRRRSGAPRSPAPSSASRSGAANPRRCSSTRPSPRTASSSPSRPWWRGSSAAARDAGALFVADEVQSGHGRTGELWGFTAGA